MISHLKALLNSRENIFLSVISFLLGVNSLFFIALVVEQVGFLAFLSVKAVYLIYFFLFTFFIFAWIFIFKKSLFSENFWRKIFWVLAFPVVVLLFGFSQSIKFNIIFKLGVGGYFVALGFYLIFKYKKYDKLSDFWKGGKKEKKPQKSWTIGLILLLVIVLHFSFGFYHLGKSAVVDEALWVHGRISKYWNNISEGEFEKTMVSDKPGITTAFLSGAGLLLVDPDDYERHDNYGRDANPPKNVENMNLAFRLPILIFCSLSLLLFFFFLKPLLGRKTALLSVIFMGLSPILLGISTIVNPDALLWIFVSLSFLAYLNYLKKQSDQWLFLAGIFLGFSILTKYVANILYVFFLGMIFWEYIFNKKKYEKIKINNFVKKYLIDYFILIFVSLVVFYIFLPRAWVEIGTFPKATLFSQAFEKSWPLFVGMIAFIWADLIFFKSKVLGFILDILSKHKKYLAGLVLVAFIGLLVVTFLNTQFDMRWFDLENILASPKTAYLTSGLWGMMLANFYSLIFGISPLVLLGLLLFVGVSLFKKDSRGYFEGLTLILFVLSYYLASSVSNVSATVRYQIVIYPIIFVVSALGFSQVLRFFSDQKRKMAFVSLSFFLMVTGVYGLNFIKPLYFSYANSLLPQKYVLNFKDMGDGSYEAAAFLNSLPNPEEIEIWTDKRGVCMFFVGTCRSGIGIEKGEFDIDYFVVSAGRKNRTTTMTLARYNGGNKKLIRLDKLYDENDPFWKLEIGERPNNFVKIIEN